MSVSTLNSSKTIFNCSPFKKAGDQLGFAKYDELDEQYGEIDEEEISDQPPGNCPDWCSRCPFDGVSRVHIDTYIASVYVYFLFKTFIRKSIHVFANNVIKRILEDTNTHEKDINFIKM